MESMRWVARFLLVGAMQEQEDEKRTKDQSSKGFLSSHLRGPPNVAREATWRHH